MKKNGLPALTKADLEKAFEDPQFLTQKAWRTSGVVHELPVSLTHLGERYVFEDKDRNRILFVLEESEPDTSKGESGILLSWRLWDTKVVFHSFVPEDSGRQKGSNNDFCELLLGGEEFEQTIDLVLRKVDPAEIYRTCREQLHEHSLESLAQILA